MRRLVLSLIAVSLVCGTSVNSFARGGHGGGHGSGHGGGHGGKSGSGSKGPTAEQQARSQVSGAQQSYLNSLDAVGTVSANIEAGEASNKDLKVAQRAVVKQAEAYLAVENTYKDKYGAYVYSQTVVHAGDVLDFAKSQEQQSTNVVFQDPTQVQVDENGIPIVDQGRKISDNTDFTGESSAEVAKLGEYGTGADFKGDALGGAAENRTYYDPASGQTAPLIAKGPAGFSGGKVFAPTDEQGARGGKLAGYALPAANAGRASGGIVASPGDKVRRVTPPPMTDALRQGKEELSFGNYTNAYRAAEKAIASDPRNPQAWQLKADVLNRLGRFGEAEKAARRAIALNPRSAEASEALAWALLNQGRYDAAIVAAQTAIAHNPQSANAYAMLAFSYEKLGQRENMIAALEKAAALDGKYQEHLKRARAGQEIFNPNAKDQWKLIYDQHGADGFAFAGGSNLVKFGLGGLATAVALLGVAVWRRRKQALTTEAPVDEDLLVGKYRLDRVVGRGGMGQVWEGLDVSLQRKVAVKQWIIDPKLQEAARRLYLNEAQTLARVNHPNIVDIFSVLDQPDGIYLVFELLEGKTVEQMIVERKQLPFAESAAILQPVAEALHFAHCQQIVHRDMKPSNIMVTPQGLPKVMDFGIARAQGSSLVAETGLPSSEALTAHTRNVAGTPEYMAPEAVQGQVSAGLDVYALGVTLYEMLTGDLPSGPYVSVRLRAPDVPAECDTLICEALQRDPAKRLRSAEEFARRLAGLRQAAGAT
jgi:tetratricopeptide (TPR) repeat protein